MNSITLKITASMKNADYETGEIEVTDPASIDEIKESAAEEFNNTFSDEIEAEEITEADPETIEINVKDWDETPEKLRELDDDFFEFVELFGKSSYDVEVFAAALECDVQLSDIDEAYQGEYSTDQDFAQNMAEQIGSLDKNAAWPMNCIDWEYAAKELMYDYCSDNGYYFRIL